MFQLNEDKSIYITRGDILLLSVSAEEDGNVHTFAAGDVVRFKVYGKKNAANVVLEKDFPVTKETDIVDIFLTGEETKIGNVISKPVDYWYEVELNPRSNPQTLIGYDEDGAKIFKLFPEGEDLPDDIPDAEDIPVVDDELDLISPRPVQNQAIARAIVGLRADFEETKNDVTKMAEDAARGVSQAEEEIIVERARIDNIVATAVAPVSGDDAAYLEVADVRVGADGKTYASAGSAVRGQFVAVNEKLERVRGYGYMADGELYIDTMNKTIHSKNLLLLTSDRSFAYVTNEPIALDNEDASLRSIFAVLLDDGGYELHMGIEADMNNYENVYYICGYYSGKLVGDNFSPNLSVTINSVPHVAYEVTMNGYHDNIKDALKERDDTLNESNQRLIDFVYNIAGVNENVVEFTANHLTAVNVSTDGNGELGEGEKKTRLSVREMMPSYNTEEIEIVLAQATTYACNIYLFDENKVSVGSTYHSGKNGKITAPINAAYFRVMIARSGGEIEIPPSDLVKIRLISKKRKTSLDMIPNTLVTEGTTHIKLLGDSITQGMGSTGYVGYTLTENGTSISVRGNGPDYKSKGDDYVVGDYLGESGARRWYESTSSTGWGNKLKDYLESKFDCVVKNYGMSGISSGNLSELCKPLVYDEDDIVLLMIGTNDRATTTKSDFRANVKSFVEYLTERNKKVVLLGATPVSVDREEITDFHMEDVNNILRSVAYACGVEFIPVYDFFMEYCDIKSIDVDSLIGDGLHPNDSGYDVMFKIICKNLGISIKRSGATW